MNWKNLFTPVKNMNAEQAKDYINTHQVDQYQLLDVRQPKEYENEHLPGAIFIPLKELPSRLDELKKEKPLIAYCAIGGRSKAAAQLLAGKGFDDVYNLVGGIKAWQGHKAKGPEVAGLELFTGEEDYPDGVNLAYAMEDGLQQFYLKLADETTSEELKKLYMQLASFETKHKARLAEEYQLNMEDNSASVSNNNSTEIMEGGVKLAEFLHKMKNYMNTKVDILEMAMMLEIQALDLYNRMAQKSSIPSTRELFFRLADEEQMHLGFLAKELDKLL